jgi:hypothetical protein
MKRIKIIAWIAASFAMLMVGPSPSLERWGKVFAQTASPSWTYTGNVSTARAGHTATLLQNGKVLVAGGATTSNVANSAELYDPMTEAWSVTGGLNVPRYLFTATLLRNGKVLVAGGFQSFGVGSSPTNTSELYDPATGIWSETGNLNGTRAWHAATLLRDGRVLIAGGWDGSSLLKTAEVYDPSTGTWSVTGSFNSPRGRFDYSLTPLQNGKVLAAGGSDTDDFGSVLTNAELYDPNTGTWSVTGDLNTGRNGHSATVLPDGNVLIAAGHGFPCSEGFCYSTVNTSAEVYNPATGTWNYTGSLSRRSNHTATLLPNGQVLVVGGWNAGYDVGRFITLDTAETHDPATGRWTSTANLNSARYFHTATLLPNGKVLAVGGFGGSDGTLRSAELYDRGASTPVNPIDDQQFFVHQHYVDFLNREPDSGGLSFWTKEITSCGTDTQCIEAKRVNVSAAFFLSIEFQETGYLVYRIYKSAFGTLPQTPVPVRFTEFVKDSQEIGKGVQVGIGDWQTQLENGKQAFALDFVQRMYFQTAYPSTLTAEQFVDQLNTNAGAVLSITERSNLISLLTTPTDFNQRAQILRAVAEDEDLRAAEFNKAFVLMQYFGYLRRNPNDPPDTDYSGFNFWLDKLNSFGGNFVNAEMVKAFIVSSEYRQRFGP